MATCEYKKCTEKAEVTGHVLARSEDGTKDTPMQVKACNKHRKVTGFFEDR